MPGSDLSLLFQLKAENSQAKATLADTQAAVTKLRASFGNDLSQMQGAAKTALSEIGENVNAFVGQRIPIIGGAFLRITSNIKGLTEELKKGGPETAKLAGQIDSIAKSSGKSSTEIAQFLTTFSRLEGQSARNEAAFKVFGGSVDLIGNKTAKFLPQLEEAGTSLAQVSTEAEGTGAAIAGMAGPIGIAVVAIGALVLGTAAAAKELFDLTKQAAEFQGRMFDLAQQTGLEVETLSALEVVAKTTGGEIGSITQAVVNFQRKLDEAQDPLSKTAEQFRKFNIETTDTETSLRQTFNALSRMPTGFAQTNAAAEFFGARGGKQVLAILKETNGNLDETIDRLRELGILISDEDARAADKFNDELALLDFQTRSLSAAFARDLIPEMIEVVRGMGALVRTIKPVVSVLGTLTAPAVNVAAGALKGLSLAVAFLTRDYKTLADTIKDALEATQIKPLSVPDVTPVPLPSAPTPLQSAKEAVEQAEIVAAAVRRNVAEQNQALDTLFQKGRIDREKQTLDIIAENAKVLKADQDRIDAAINQKKEEIKALDEAQKNRGEIVKRDSSDYEAVNAQIVNLQQERLDKEAEFDRTSAALRAKAAKERADSSRNQIQNETDLLTAEFDRQIKSIEAKIKVGTTPESSGLTIIEQLERAKIDAQIESLQKQKAVGFLTVQNQVDLNNQLKKLEQDRDRLADEQAARRAELERASGQTAIDIATANIDALIHLEQTAGQRRIDTIKSLADLRVLTEEEAAKQILQIQLDLIDDEIAATKSKLNAAGTIVDKNERLRTEAELNNQIRALTEERKTIQANGNRDIEAGRQLDLENERRYASDLARVREQIRNIERDTAKEVIDLMRIHFASRKDLIRARLQLDIDDENSRHQQALDELQSLEEENANSKRTKEEKLEFEKEINREREAEAERHRLAMQGITDQGKKDEEGADPLGRIGLDTENLKEFANIIEGTIVPLGQILTNTFSQVADAIGQTVSNYVLLGQTGPAVMRKILATALATIAAEAAVNAIKELALGFATLFFNPAESAAHFTAAGLWAAIGGVTAIAGRAVAGDLFKQPGASGGSGGGRGSTAGRQEASPIDLTRQRQEQVLRVFLHVESNDSHIVSVIHQDVNKNGSLRDLIGEVAGA